MSKLCIVNAGGGAMGVISVTFLQHLEAYVQKTYNVKLTDVVDFVAGTSVGGIINGVFSAGVPYNDIYDMMTLHLDKAFYRGLSNYWPLNVKYDRNKYLMPMICELINKYGKDSLADAKIRVMITTTLIGSEWPARRMMPYYFKSYVSDYRSVGKPLSFAISCSFAAADYFGYITDDVTKTVYGDGGEGIENMPFEEMVDEIDCFNWTDPTLVLALGTGWSDPYQGMTQDQIYKQNSKRGIIGQIKDFLGIARSQAMYDQFNHFSRGKQNTPAHKNIDFSYVDTQVPTSLDGMDYITHVMDYVGYGNKMWLDFVNTDLPKVDAIIKAKLSK